MIAARSLARTVVVATALAVLSPSGALLAQPAPGPDRVVAEGNAALGPGTFNLSDPAIGLSAISSYRAGLMLSFVGTLEGRPYQWTETRDLRAGAAGRVLTVTTDGLPDAPSRLLAWTDGATLWERADNGACVATAMTEAPAEAIEPAALLPVFFGAEAAGAEAIGGIATLRYTFDERALGDAGLARSAGEIWVAAEDGHVVGYRLTITAGPDYFGAGMEGTATLEYQVTALDEPVAIEPPADCPAGLVDLPLPAGATPNVNLPGLLAYATAMPVADAVAFHREQLAALGWEEQPVLFEAETVTVLEFTAGQRRLILRVAANAMETGVELALSSL